MKMLNKLIANSMLLAVLFGLLFLPIGSIGLTDLKPVDVLGDQDVRPLPLAAPPSHGYTNPQPVEKTYYYEMDLPTTQETTSTESLENFGE
jgi:hypothetical protein